jgi:hypothetical protein
VRKFIRAHRNSRVLSGCSLHLIVRHGFSNWLADVTFRVRKETGTAGWTVKRPCHSTAALAASVTIREMEKEAEQIERLLLSDRPLRELKPFFSDWEAVLDFHARKMSDRYLCFPEVLACTACDRSGHTIQAVLHWRATYGNSRTALITLLLLLHHSAHMQIDFRTHHLFCESCYRSLAYRKVLAELARYAKFIAVLLCGGLFAMSLLYLIVVVLDFNRQAFEIFALGFVLGGGGVVLAIWIGRKLDLWCVPAGLRFITKYPFQLYNLRKLKY